MLEKNLKMSLILAASSINPLPFNDVQYTVLKRKRISMYQGGLMMHDRNARRFECQSTTVSPRCLLNLVETVGPELAAGLQLHAGEAA